MNNSNLIEQVEANHRVIPTFSTRISRDGYSFCVDDNRWALNKDIEISFQSEILELEPRLLKGFRQALSVYAEEVSAYHTFNMYHNFQRMVRHTQCTSIDEQTLLNWRASLDHEHEWYLGSLRGFLVSWYEHGYYGITADMVKLLERMRLAGNTKGVAVANRCPHYGAFTDNEMLALGLELVRLFDENCISLPCYAYISTLQATARRPIQLRQLKASDLIKKNNPNNDTTNYYLNIPRAKQRNVSFRGDFKTLPIIKEVYSTLKNLISQETEKLESLFEVELSSAQKEQVPMFIDWNMATELFDKETPLTNDLLFSDLLHIPTKTLDEEYMKSFQRQHEAHSERTGDYIHVTARRFRHTRATNLGRQGIGPLLIAEALDHSDTQNVMVYVENSADTVTYIDQAIGKQLAPFAQAFMGRIITSLEDGERGFDPTAKIPNKDSDVVGACGTNDFCINGYESCYTCEKFRPLLDAPHELFLASLYAEKEARLRDTKNTTYAETKDRLILAVEWVVQQCAEIKAARNANEQ